MQNKPPPMTKKSAAAIVASAALAVAPFTIGFEGMVKKAYLDPIKKPTICGGHTKGVVLGQVANDILCKQFLTEDMTNHMNDVIGENPEMITNINNGVPLSDNFLKAAGDFTFNTGAGGWKGSPMSSWSKKGDLTKACQSFTGYMTGATYPKDQPGMKCHPSQSKPGKFICELPGLVRRRLAETQLCLTGK